MEVITAMDVKTRLESGEALNLLDVRQPQEHEEFNIGGTLLPLSQIQSMQTEDIDALKDAEIICYCKSGNRSMMASIFLEQMGFSNVKNMAGGIEAYKKL